jgi:hypothetical protein
LPKLLPRKVLSAEKEARVEETTQILPEVFKRTHSQMSEGNYRREGVPITRTDAVIFSARGGVAPFAQKYDFKYVWHAAGKVVKQKISACESEMKKRFPTVWGGFADLPVLLGKQSLSRRQIGGNWRKIATPSYYRKTSLSTRSAPILWLRQQHEGRVPSLVK